MEIKDLEQFDNMYSITSEGQIWSKKTNKYLIGSINQKGYRTISIYHKGKTITVRPYRLVAQSFIPNPNNLPQVNHKDENKLNDCVDNLEWCDNWYNEHYGTRAERGGLKRRKPIIQYDKDWNFIKEWDSATTAGKELNIDARRISEAIYHQRNTTGFN